MVNNMKFIVYATLYTILSFIHILYADNIIDVIITRTVMIRICILISRAAPICMGFLRPVDVVRRFVRVDLSKRELLSKETLRWNVPLKMPAG